MAKTVYHNDGIRSMGSVSYKLDSKIPNEKQNGEEMGDEKLSDCLGSMGARQVHDVDCLNHLFQVYCPNDGRVFVFHRKPMESAHEYLMIESELHQGASRSIWFSSDVDFDIFEF